MRLHEPVGQNSPERSEVRREPAPMTCASAVTSPSTSTRLSPGGKQHKNQRKAEYHLGQQSTGARIHVLSLGPSTRYAHIVSTNPSSPEPAAKGPAPVDVDGVVAVLLGTIGFAAGLLACVIFRDSLATQGNQWWTWVCVTGTVLGLAGLVFVLRRRAAYRAHNAAH